MSPLRPERFRVYRDSIGKYWRGLGLGLRVGNQLDTAAQVKMNHSKGVRSVTLGVPSGEVIFKLGL